MRAMRVDGDSKKKHWRSPRRRFTRMHVRPAALCLSIPSTHPFAPPRVAVAAVVVVVAVVFGVGVCALCVSV
eukprot:363048-Chlamydomonas_euryale.AAC.3